MFWTGKKLYRNYNFTPNQYISDDANMSTSMVVGVTVSAVFVLLVVGVVLLVCVLSNRTPRKRNGIAKTAKKGTENISKRLVN